MQIVSDLNNLPESLRHGAVAIGNFDGVHRGHARIIERLRAQAKTVGGPAIVFTFDPHPVRLLRPEQTPPPLTWTQRKAELLAELGVDSLIVYPTDAPLLALSPQAFFQSIVVDQLAARAMVEGPNFRFGRGRAGTIDTLRELCRAAKIALEIVEPLAESGDLVSSSRVRALLAAGDVAAARQLLTQPYRLRGMVIHGAKRGASIGFPTANLEAIDTLLPAHGVYAGRGHLRSTSTTDPAKKSYPAAINIGPNPTFGEARTKVEVHLIGAAGTFYGEVLEVDILARLRDIQPFANVDELRTQLQADVARAIQLAAAG